MKRIIALLIVLLLVACAQQQETIKVGFMGPLTGDVSVYGVPAQKSVQLAAKEINSQGGINGVPIEIVYEDTKCSGKEAVNIMNKLVSIDRVDAVVGTVCSSAAVPAYPIAEQAGIVMLGYGTSSPELSENTPYFFRTFPSDALQGRVGAELTLEAGFKKVAVFHVDDEYGTAFKDVYTNNIQSGGGEIVVVESYTPGDVEFKTQLQKIEQKEPEMVYLIAFPREGGLILKQAKELGLNVPFRGTEVLNDPSFIESAGEAAEGMIITWPKGVEGTPAYDSFASGYFELHGEEIGSFGAEAYDALKLLAKAMSECGVAGDEIKKCLDNLENYEGASGTITFDEFGDVQKEYDVYVIQDGEFVKLD